ncbi:synaptotagmin-like protein 2 isoform X10 [Microtus ochrogaster]|uniref:Synaptotagmin-like protein 2 isoform X10 n=1 Tax=Microtus ochrogaster TaxID=79684 RepID=A0ABM1UDL3_MICOH|nr:synaptotagmin-like protein 2 isoform X10 [Microtus ochrogaster]
MSSLQHLQGLDPRQQTDSEPQITVPLMTDNTCVKGDSKILPSTKIKRKPVRLDSTFQEEGHVPVSEACQDADALLKSNSANRSQEGTPKEGLDTLQPFERYRIPSQRSVSMVCSQGSESTGEGCGTVSPNSSYLLSALKRSEAEPQVPWNPKRTGSLGKEESKFHVPQKSKGNTYVNVGTSAIVLDYNSKDDLEGQSKTRNTAILKPSLKPENGELPLGAADSGSSWRKPEGQEEAGEGPQNQVLRETYKSVSDRISFWEGEKVGAKIKAKEPTPSCGQEPPFAKVHKPAKSQVMFTGSSTPGQSEFGQVTAKEVVLDEDDQTPRLSCFYPSNKPKTTRPPTSGASKTYPSADQSDKVSPLHTPGGEICHSSEKDRFVIDQPNASFKVLSLKERMGEPNMERAYHHSQFENLRKFWGLGANVNNTDNDETNTSAYTRKSVPFDSQKSKEFDSMKSSRENTHVEEGRHLRQGHITAAEEMETSSSKGIFQAPPDETAVPRKPPRTFTYHSAGSEPSKENVGKNMGRSVAPVTEETKDCSDQEIQEPIVKTSILPPVSKDTFNHRLQKLLAEGAVSATQTSGRSVQEQKALHVGVSETGSHKAGFNEEKEDVSGPKKTLKERVDEVVALPQVQQSSSVDQLLKEAARSSSTPLPSPLELVTARPNSPSKDDRLFERWIERKHSPSGDQRGLIAPSPQGVENSDDTALTQKAERWNPEGQPQPAAERSFPPAQPFRFFEGISNSSTAVSLTQNTRLVSQDGTLPSQGEISEAIEQVVLPSRPKETSVDAVLQRLLREAGEVKTTPPERVQTADRPSSSQRVSPPWTAVDAVVPDMDFRSFNTAPDTVHEGGSYLSAGMSPSEHLVRSSVSAVTQQVHEPLQEVVKTVRETLIQPKLECLEFRAGLEKLLKETLESSLSKEEDTETISPSAVTGRCEMSQQLASEFCPKEIQETVEKVEAPSVTQSAFDDGFEKLLKEMSEGPCQLGMSAKEDSKKQPSQAEQDRFLGKIPHLYQNAPGTSKMEAKCKGLESELNLGDKLLGGDEAVIGPSVDVRGYPHGFGVPEHSQLYGDYKIETIETVQSVGDRSRERAVTESTWAPQEPDFEEAPEEVSVSRNKQPIALLESTGNPTAMSKAESILAVPHKRQDKERRLEASSESEFSDGNASSNGESWRNTSECSEEEHSPVLRALGRSAARTMPSKSLDDISSDSANQAKVDNLPEDLVRSAEDDQKADQEPDTNEGVPGISTAPSPPDNQFSHPDKLKRMSKSVPAFLQDESDDRETDTASESSYQLRRYKKSPSSLTNLSSSSGMTSLSSVSGSVMSVYSGDFGNLEVKGSVQFAVDYVESLRELHVFVAQCKDLAAADAKKQRSDPYVKTYLLPDKGKMGKKKTLVVKKSLNPVYNEILRYKVERQVLKTQKLNLSVWHRDTFKRNSFLGEVELDLETWDWDSKQNKQLKWYPLKRKTAPVALETENRGEMKLALQYVPEPNPGKKPPTTGEVHIWVKECLDLPLLRGSHLNSFVKCTILPDTSRKSRQKTRAVGKTTNPIFNHTMVYDGFRPEDLMEACVELTVWDHYKLTNQFLGGLRIGFGTGKSYGTEVDWMDSTSEEVALWEKMANSPNTWVEATLPLRMLLIAKISK